MQITRFQNQPNFKSRVRQADRITNAAYLSTDLAPKMNEQFRKLEKIGGEDITFIQYFNPKNLAPFSIQLERDRIEEPILKTDLHLSQLAEKGQEAFNELMARDAAKDIHPEKEMSINDLNNAFGGLDTRVEQHYD